MPFLPTTKKITTTTVTRRSIACASQASWQVPSLKALELASHTRWLIKVTHWGIPSQVMRVQFSEDNCTLYIVHPFCSLQRIGQKETTNALIQEKPNANFQYELEYFCRMWCQIWPESFSWASVRLGTDRIPIGPHQPAMARARDIAFQRRVAFFMTCTMYVYRYMCRAQHLYTCFCIICIL